MSESTATNDYISEKLYDHIMKSVEKHYRYTDTKASMYRILMDNSGVLNVIKKKDDNLLDFHVFANMVDTNIILTTELDLLIGGRKTEYRFSCVIEAKFKDEILQ